MALKASRQPADDPGATTVNLWFIRRELGQHGYSDRRMVAYVTKLIEEHNFPSPLPAMRKGGSLTSAVTTSSTWQRAAVESWIEGWLPPDATAAIDRKAQAEAAAAMDGNASHLHLIRGGRA
ncbi:hypothetical protein [Novosphingobium capsulatum]|uniref:hypothetical protein n=1 Tax=Novosphingobium capsulatum TaxID=13688 RepID=UPI002E0F51C4|nr:hypothetical protein U0041_03930 [Novosphingobium capsulatum]